VKIKVDHEKLVVLTRDTIYLIMFSEILYVERFDKKTLIQTNNKEISIHISLKKISEFLPSNFIRTHQSYIINRNVITELKSINPQIYEINFTDDKTALVKKEYLHHILPLGTS